MDVSGARKRTDEYVLERAREILENARRSHYFMFKCRIETAELSMPLILSFGKGGDIFFEKQLGWARFYRDAGGKPNPEAALHFREIVEREILASDGIEPWGKGSVRRSL